jgi:hypothetical protein
LPTPQLSRFASAFPGFVNCCIHPMQCRLKLPTNALACSVILLNPTCCVGPRPKCSFRSNYQLERSRSEVADVRCAHSISSDCLLGTLLQAYGRAARAVSSLHQHK